MLFAGSFASRAALYLPFAVTYVLGEVAFPIK